MREREPGSVSAPPLTTLATPLAGVIARDIAAAGGWIGFDRYMAAALYTPGLGYYANAGRKFGPMPASGSDFVTAPELSPLFARALARQLRQAMEATGTSEIVEFGAGSGALAAGLLDALDADGAGPWRYTIVDLSQTLRERQQQRLAAHGDRVRWLDAWPEAIEGVVVANELLDAMPVQLLHWDGEAWQERGVALDANGGFVWADRPTALRPPVDDVPFVPGTTVELHAQAEAWIRSLAERLARGAAFLIDYGFPVDEYYHPQRTGGTLMCHRAHRADADPLVEVGLKDLTAHVDFTGIALAGQDAGLEVLGYTSQARFLFNCGIAEQLAAASLPERIAAQPLVLEHEMGELFKVIGFVRGEPFDAIGFVAGDRSHRL